MLFKSLLFSLCFLSLNITAQNISLNDLQIACNKTNWEYANQYLLNKGWEYYGSEKGSTENYNTITWSYDKSSYNNKAAAWFYLFTYEGFPNKISYSVFNKAAYQKIQNSLGALGYKLISNSIEDDAIINNYANNTFSLKIITEKRKPKDDYSYSDETFTAYKFLLVKRNGIFDSNNGKKVFYFDGTNDIKVVYNLKEGIYQGDYISYHPNGTKKMVGQYKNDEKNGPWNEYSDTGLHEGSYTMKNGELDGIVKIYFYSDEGVLLGVKKNNYINGELHGINQFVYVDETNNERVLSYTNYSKGLKEGPFQEVEGDSLIFGSYKADKLDGAYRIFIDYNKRFDGGVIETDTTQLTIQTRGHYLNDAKSKHWKNYDITGSLIEEGYYTNDAKSGVWKSYYLKFINKRTGELNEHSQELYLEENYNNGYKNGESKRYSYFESKPIDCALLESPLASETENCTYLHYVKQTVISNYFIDELHGDYLVKDSIGTVISKGQFKDDKRDGFWLQSYTIDEDDMPIYVFKEGYYKEGSKEGKWIEYVNKTNVLLEYNYKNDLFQGDYTIFDVNSKITEVKTFDHGELKQLKVFDANGQTIEREYHILSETTNNIQVRYLGFLTEGGQFEIDYLVTKPKEDLSHHDFENVFHGQLQDESQYYQDGLFLIRNEDGSTSIKGETYRNVNAGTWEYHYPKQNVKIITTYIDHSNKPNSELYYTIDTNQLFNGDFIYVNSGTEGTEERRIRDGLRDGNTIYFNKAGDKEKKEKYKDGILSD